MSRTKISVIIPTYNEKEYISKCIQSLILQTEKNLEILIVDDGSTDGTQKVIEKILTTYKNLQIKIFFQNHKGPGEARNLGAEKANGKILVFIDGDMTFDKNFIKNLVAPIKIRKTIGTDTQEVYLANPENFWSASWNVGRFAAAKAWNRNPFKEMIPNKRNFGGIFRAITKSEFQKVGGFETGGNYTDDSSLAKKLKIRASLVRGAIYYHYNPSSFIEVWQRAVWIGSDTNFQSNRVINLIKFFPLISPIKGFMIANHFNYYPFILFKVLYDSAMFWALLKTL